MKNDPYVTNIYNRVNALYQYPLPKLTGDEAIRAARRLYRVGMGKPFAGQIKITSGNRYTWIRNGVMVVNPDHGWKQLAHMLSHYCHRRVNNERPHSEAHALIELKMATHIIENGWLSGSLKKEEKPKPDIRTIRRQRILARLESWERRAKRANNAIRKLRRQAKYYS